MRRLKLLYLQTATEDKLSLIFFVGSDVTAVSLTHTHTLTSITQTISSCFPETHANCEGLVLVTHIFIAAVIDDQIEEVL